MASPIPGEVKQGMAQEVARPKAGRNGFGVVSLRYQGASRSGCVALVLTVPAKVARSLSAKYGSRQRYTCELNDTGQIIFSPVSDD